MGEPHNTGGTGPRAPSAKGPGQQPEPEGAQVPVPPAPSATSGRTAPRPAADMGLMQTIDAGPSTVTPAVSASAMTPIAVDAPPDAMRLPRGTSIGRYLVTERLGAGGMGVVYAAYDPELNRKVAIKLLHAQREDESLMTSGRMRLLREAQAMAKLSHPNVIGVYDVGTLNSQVFVAMEFVDGGTLTAWLQEAPRTRRQILEKFLQAGRGLAAAHAADLVHRDFKPDNVLVRKDGQVRVTDFGLARVIDSGERPLTSSFPPGQVVSQISGQSTSQLDTRLTQPGALMGTPQYMAPEQFCGEPTDARTDQFSFCVALYEALHGETPFAGKTLATLAESVLSGRVTPPSTKVPKWIRQVLLRGLRTRREERYPSMDALLLALSRDPRRTYARIGLGATCAAVLALMALGYMRLSNRGERMCRGAERRLIGVWDQQSKDEVRAQVLRSGAAGAEMWSRIEAWLDGYSKKWVAMQEDACRATHVRGEQSHALLDLRMHCLSRRRQDMASFAAALAQADQAAVEQAVGALVEFPRLEACADARALSMPVPLPEEPKRRAEVDRLFRELAALRAQSRIGRFKEVIASARSLAAQADKTAYAPLAAEVQVLLGELLNDAGDNAASDEAMFSAALQGIAGRQLAVTASAFTQLCSNYGNRRRIDESRRYELLADAAIRAAGDDPDARSKLENALGVRAYNLKRYEEAMRHFQDSLKARSQIFGPEHYAIVNQLGNVALVMQALRRFDEAFSLRQRALQISEQHLGPLHPRVALSYEGLGQLKRMQGQLQESHRYYTEARRRIESALGPEHPRVASLLRAVGQVYSEEGRYREAEEALVRALAIVEKQPHPDENDLSRSLQGIAALQRRQSRFAEAVASYDRMLALRTATYGAKHLRVASVLYGRGLTRLFAQDAAGAEQDATQALEIYAQSPDAVVPEVAVAYLLRGRARAQLKQLEPALSDLQEAMKRRSSLLDLDDQADVLIHTAEALAALHKAADAQRTLDEAAALKPPRPEVQERVQARIEAARAVLLVSARPRSSRACRAALQLLGSSRAALERLGPTAVTTLREVNAIRLPGC